MNNNEAVFNIDAPFGLTRLNFEFFVCCQLLEGEIDAKSWGDEKNMFYEISLYY